MKYQAENGNTITARDQIQASAFEKAGLKLVGEDELETLKAQADELGIEYSPNIGVKTLKERIEKALS